MLRSSSLLWSSEPLPVQAAHVLDYKESPETGVVFDLEPPAGTIFSRVNITFTEGEERRSMLYKGTQVLKLLPENLSGFSDFLILKGMLHFRFLPGEDSVQALAAGGVLPGYHLPAGVGGQGLPDVAGHTQWRHTHTVKPPHRLEASHLPGQ